MRRAYSGQPVTASLDTDYPFREALTLKAGDVVRLENSPVNEPLAVKIGNRRKFLCRPGTMGNKVSVQIVKKLEETRPAELLAEPESEPENENK